MDWAEVFPYTAVLANPASLQSLPTEWPKGHAISTALPFPVGKKCHQPDLHWKWKSLEQAIRGMLSGRDKNGLDPKPVSLM